MKLIIIVMMLIGMAIVMGGSSGAPSIVNLSGVSPDVFDSPEFAIEPLGDPHYFSEGRVVVQEDLPTEMNLKNWSDERVPFPKSL